MTKWHGTQNRKTNEKREENKHVQNPATKVTIKLFDGRKNATTMKRVEHFNAYRMIP